MRRFFLFLVFGGFVCFHSYAQWVVQTAPTSFEARGVHMTSSQQGYIVGSDGNMLKTMNAGDNWTVVNTAISDTLRSVFFIDQNTGYVVGAHGTIRKTTDGGLNWVSQTSGVLNLLRSVYFVNSSVGFICGGGGVILKTTNGGDNWTLQTSGTTNDLINIRFANEYTGYVASSLSTFMSGIILKTIDGGVTWNSVYTNTNGLLGLAVIGDVIYAGGGYQTIVKSDDAGSTWTQVNPASATANHFRSAAFISADTGYVVGDVGMIYYTTNGGASWTDQTVNTLGVLSVFVVNKDTIFGCGLTSNIIRYTSPCNPEQPATIFGDASLCANDTTTFYVTPVAGVLYYNWHVPTNSTILSGQGTPQVTVHFGNISGYVSVADSNLCGSSAYTMFYITVFANPPIPTITQNLSTLTSSSTTGNQWYLNGFPINGATAQTYTITQNGIYRVKVTLANTCSSISNPFNVTNVGISDQQLLTGEIAVIPNPVKQTATLNFQLTETASVQVAVYDILGNKAMNLAPIRLQAGEQQIALDCISFSKGIYLVKMLINDNMHFIKFLKE